MMQAMPILLLWLFAGLGGSVLAMLENRWRISEEKLVRTKIQQTNP
jgi:hypothetical protein